MSGPPRRPGDPYEIGYAKPPKKTRFRKGVSGNPRGRPKKKPGFMEDAMIILSTPVTGHANGKAITLPMIQAMFRGTCKKALKGDNAALRRVIDLILVLEPPARRSAEENAAATKDAREYLYKKLGLDPDAIDNRPKTPDPDIKEIRKQADAMAREERKRLIREARKHQKMR